MGGRLRRVAKGDPPKVPVCPRTAIRTPSEARLAPPGTVGKVRRASGSLSQFVQGARGQNSGPFRHLFFLNGRSVRVMSPRGRN